MLARRFDYGRDFWQGLEKLVYWLHEASLATPVVVPALEAEPVLERLEAVGAD